MKLVNTIDLKSVPVMGYRFKSDSKQLNELFEFSCFGLIRNILNQQNNFNYRNLSLIDNIKQLKQFFIKKQSFLIK